MKSKFFLQAVVFCLLIFHSNDCLSQKDSSADRKSYLTKVQISEPVKVKVCRNLWKEDN